MKTYLAISAIGHAQPNLLDQLSRTVLDCGCSVRDARMTLMGSEFAMILLVEGNWNNIAKLEAVLPGLEKRLHLTVTARRTEQLRTESNLLPYAVEVVALDQPGIVHHLANFFSTRGITICDLITNAYAAASTGTCMFSLHMTVDVPADLQIAALREDFMDFCDRFNMDAVLEPAKA